MPVPRIGTAPASTASIGAVPTSRVLTHTQPAAGLTIATASQDLSANRTWTYTLANDLAALEGLSSTGFAVRISTDSWAQRTITAGNTSILISSGNGILGNPTISTAQAILTTSSPSFAGFTTISGKLTGSTPTFNVTGGSFLFTEIDSTNTSAPTLTENLAAGSLSAGTYTYQVTFVTADGETEFRNDSAVITVSAGSAVALTGISTHSGATRVTARKIYRSRVGNNIPFYNARYYPMYLVTTINDNTTTTYTDTMSDATLITQTKRFYSNDTAGAVYLKTEQLSTPMRLMNLNYLIDNNAGQRGEVSFGPSGITAIREDGQIIFNNIQEDQTAVVYPSRSVGFTWLISTDFAGMAVKELDADQMEYGFYSGDNDTGDFYRFQMNASYNGHQNDKTYLEISGNSSAIHSGLQVDGGDFILQGSSLHSMVREATATTAAATTIYIDNTLPPPSTNGLTLTGNSAAYTGTADSTFFIKIVSVGTPSTFKWRQGGDFSDTSGYNIPQNIVAGAITLTAGVTITFNQTTGGIANQIYHFRVLAPSRFRVNYGGLHYMNGRYFIGGTSTASAYIHLAAGTATAGTAPFKFTSGVSLTTPEAGASEYDGQAFFLTALKQRRSVNTAEGIIVSTATDAVINEQTLFTEAMTGNEWTAKKTMKVVVIGRYTNQAAAMVWNFKLGSTTVFTYTSPTTNVTNAPFKFEFYLTCRTTGLAGTFWGYLDTTVNNLVAHQTLTAASTIDTTVAENVTVTQNWGVGPLVPGTTVSVDMAWAEVLN